MSRRVHALWRLATTCSHGCPAKMSSWGLEEAFISSPERPALKRAQRGCMFHALDETGEKADSKRWEVQPVNDNGKGPIVSFIESYFAAHQKYPTIALVARKTGRHRKEVRHILNDVKSGSSAVDSQMASKEGLSDLNSTDTMCSTSDYMSNEIWKEEPSPYGRIESESLAEIIGSATAEALVDGTGMEDFGNFADILSGTGNSGASDQEFLEWLDQSSTKEKAIKKTAPLIEVLQQTAGGSRRVHLSAWRGVEKDVSWDRTLRSIMPSSIENKQQNLCDDSSTSALLVSSLLGEHSTSTCSSGTDIDKVLTSEDMGKDSQSAESKHVAEIDKVSTSGDMGKDSQSTPEFKDGAEIDEVSTSGDVGKDSQSTSLFKYGVRLKSTIISGAILNGLSSEYLVRYLKSHSEVFLDMQKKVDRCTRKGYPSHAILYFKTEKGMKDALNLKTIQIGKERFHLESLTEAIIFNQEIDLCSLDFLQLGITLEDFPVNISLESIHEFFSVFGEVQIVQDRAFPRSEGVLFLAFKNEYDKKKALRVHQFMVDGCIFCIRTDVSSNQLVIRLVSEQDEADKKKAMDACQKYGVVTHFDVCKPGVLVAHYRESERTLVKKILDSLYQDKDLEGVWKPMVVYDGYSRSSQTNLKDRFDGDMKFLLNLTQKLSNHVERMYYDRNEKTEDKAFR